VLLTAGGMVLGPIVQKHAFGHYWTGFPAGRDLTDNKMLIMWLAWVGAVGVVALGPNDGRVVKRLAVVVAALAMTGAYLIPHSMRGSELDHAAVDAGVDPAEAIGTSED